MQQPPAGYTINQSPYPLTIDVATPPQIERWRPLVHWLLAIPHLILLGLYGFVAAIVGVIAWVAALFTGQVPEGLANFLTSYLRYSWRVYSFYFGLRTTYPAFSAPSGYADPGDDPAVLNIQPPQGPMSRLRVFFRGIILIPQFIVLYVVGIAFGVVGLIAWFAVLFTGVWPEGLRNFALGFFRWEFRVLGYYYLLTDVYPPFSLT
jgi:hypothetical protein